MKMVCEECGNVFNEEEAAGGKLLFSGNDTEPPEYDDLRCPECGSEDIEEATLCPICGEYYCGRDGDICQECQIAIVEAIDRLAEDLAENDIADAKKAILTFITEVMA